MPRYALGHLADRTLLSNLATLVARDRSNTAELLAHIAEVDARQLYLPAAFPSMFAYCLGELRMSEDEAYKRIQAARAGRRFPAIFDALAQGRLHLSAVVLLAPHLAEHTADELLAAAMHKTKAQIEGLLAARFSRSDVLAWMVPISAPPGPSSVTPPCVDSPGSGLCQLVPEPIETLPTQGQENDPPVQARNQLVPEPVHTQPAPGQVGDHRVKPLSSQSFAMRCTLSQRAHDRLRYAQQLLGHQVPSGDLALVIEEAIEALVEKLEKRKFAATSKPRPNARRRSNNPRHIPAHVKRAVWKRDGGQCTFVSATGHRCPARARLEFDHVLEMARGGEATISGIRLRCRAHNQYEAERTFGAEFMCHKRRAAAEARAGLEERLPVAAGHQVPGA